MAKYLGLGKEEIHYLFLLIDYEKCALEELKDELKNQIQTIQVKQTQSDKYIDKQNNELTSEELQEYYLLPENQLIHLALSIPKYQKDIEKLREDLKVNKQLFAQSLKILSRLGLIEVHDSKVKLLKSNLHLKHDSPFFHQWKAQMNLKSIEWTKFLETKEKIRIELLNYLKTIEKLVSVAPSKKLYQLHFDLHKWI